MLDYIISCNNQTTLYITKCVNHLLIINIHTWRCITSRPRRYMGFVATKPVFGVSDKVRFKLVSSATETR